MDRQSTLTMICQSAKEIGNTGELIADRGNGVKHLFYTNVLHLFCAFWQLWESGSQMKPTFSGVKQV